MKYYAIYDSDMGEEKFVEFIRKQTDIQDKCTMLYLGVIEDESEMEEFIDEQREGYEFRKKLH